MASATRPSESVEEIVCAFHSTAGKPAWYYPIPPPISHLFFLSDPTPWVIGKRSLWPIPEQMTVMMIT